MAAARALKRAALALAATAAALLAAEGLVRAFGDVPGVKPIWFSRDDSIYRRSQNPVLSFELEPGYRNPNPDLVRTYERINSHGQRDPERSLAKPGGVKRVLLLGDSVVEGHGVREVDTLSQQLERLLGAGFEVLNFGVSGYCTKAEIELLATKGLAFAPDQVVLLFVGNDFNDFNAETFELGGSLHQPLWARRLFVGSELFRMLCLRLDWFGFVAQVDPVAWNQAAIGDNNVVEGLDRLRALAKEKGFGVLLAIWPEFEQDAIVDLFYMPGQSGAGELVIERRRDSAAGDGDEHPRCILAVERDESRPDDAGRVGRIDLQLVRHANVNRNSEAAIIGSGIVECFQQPLRICCRYGEVFIGEDARERVRIRNNNLYGS